MPKKDIDNIKENDEKLTKLLEDIKKSNPDMTEEEIDELVEALNRMAITAKGPKKYLIRLIKLIFRYIAMVISTIIILSFAISYFKVDKIMIFPISFVVAIPFTLINACFLFGVSFYKKGFLFKFLLVNLLIMLTISIANLYCYRVFDASAMWFVIGIGIVVLYTAIDYILNKYIAIY